MFRLRVLKSPSAAYAVEERFEKTGYRGPAYSVSLGEASISCEYRGSSNKTLREGSYFTVFSIPLAFCALSADSAELELFEQVEHVIHASGLIEHYSKDPAGYG